MLRRFGLLLLLLGMPTVAHAQAWTKDAGRAFLSLGYSLSFGGGIYGSDFEIRSTDQRYTEHVLSLYAEVGIVDRWLTAILDLGLLRHHQVDDAGATRFADSRVGLFTGLLDTPLRVSVGLNVGLPMGDDDGDPGVSDVLSRRALATGDGEFDFEPTLALGYSFLDEPSGFEFYTSLVVAYQIRTRGFDDGIRFAFDFGFRFHRPIIDRFWFVLRLQGVESFAADNEVVASFNGMGNGVTYTAPAIEVSARIVSELRVFFGFSGGVRARSIVAGPTIRTGLSYEF